MVIGSPHSGKTSLVSRYVNGTFQEEYVPTVLCDFMTKKTEYKYTFVTFNFFDVSGYDEFTEQRSRLYTDANAALILYSCTSE